MKRQVIYPLSKIQEQFWVLANIAPNNTAYNIPLVYRLSSNVNIPALKHAIDETLNTYKILGAKIVVDSGKPCMQEQEGYKVNDYFTEVIIPSKYSLNLFKKYILKEVHKPFQIEGGNLLRIRHFEFEDQRILTIVFHHIIIDLRSKEIFVKELSKRYNNHVNSKRDTEVKIGCTFMDFVADQNQFLLSEKASSMRHSWKEQLQNSSEQLEFPNSSTINHKVINAGKRKAFSIDESFSTQVRLFADKNNVTPFVCLLSAWAICLYRFTGQSNFCIGVPFTNRRIGTFKDTVGCFVNILPLSIQISANDTVIDVISQVRIGLLKNHRKQEIPFIEINGIAKEEGIDSLFQTGFTFEGPVQLTLHDVKTEYIEVEREGSQLEIFNSMWEDAKGFHGFMEYDTNRFSSNDILQYIDSFKLIVDVVCKTPLLNVHEFDLLSKKEWEFISQLNNTSCEFEDNICIHQKFEFQTDKTPNAIAIQSGKIKLTYAEVEKYSNRLANHLIKKRTIVGDVIAICCERSPEMMVSILAILKAGAAYLPMHIDNPTDRNNVIIKDANPRFLLCSNLGSRNISCKEKVIFIDNLLSDFSEEKDTRPEVVIDSNSLAYILYTSGSTGTPKGTLIEHRSVLNRIGWMQKNYTLDHNDVLLQKTPITFDVSVWELFWWFFNGARLAILKPEGEKDPLTIVKAIKAFNVSRIHFVPSMFSSFLFVAKANNLLEHLTVLKTIFLSGEALPAPMVNDFNKERATYNLPPLVNLYGPTEATVDVSYFNCPEKITENEKIYIGKPIDNTGLYIVNSKSKLQPLNVKGELIITGVNLSRGYLNKKELTKKSFINFQAPDGSIKRAYKTGDICILRENGQIEYAGRSDNQIKIRGLRIELGDIESKLLLHPFVKASAAIVAFEGDKKSIVAYVELKEKEQTSSKGLINFLRDKLPSYMIPTHLLILDSIPLSTNGKTDRKKLPLPYEAVSGKSPVLPHDKLEFKVLKLWKEVLGRDNISVTDNFFDIGGNSILSIKLSTLIGQEFNLSITVVSIMEFPNIVEFCKYLNQQMNKPVDKEVVNSQREFKKRDNTNRRSKLRR